jgi:uncharacterized protein YbbK (DUF523 family)
MRAWRDFDFFCNATATAKPTVAISACLNGEAVRYDGADQYLEAASTLLAQHLTLHPICPEVGAGLSVPRPPVQLVKNSRGLNAIGRDDTKLNVSAALLHYRQQSLQQLQNSLCGYIFKSRSPSCGLGSTPIFNPEGQQIDTGNGLQADYFLQHLPWLAFTEETALQSTQHCDQFIFRCLLAYDLQYATQQTELTTIHHHYQFLIRTMDRPLQTQLATAVANNNAGSYRTQLMKGVSQMHCVQEKFTNNQGSREATPSEVADKDR